MGQVVGTSVPCRYPRKVLGSGKFAADLHLWHTVKLRLVRACMRACSPLIPVRLSVHRASGGPDGLEYTRILLWQ